MARRRERRTTARPAGTGRALLWTLGSAVLPGIAHLRTGRRAAGWGILTLFIVLIAAVVGAGLLFQGDMARSARLAVQGRWLFTASAIAFGIAVLWMTVVIHSWVITRPSGSGWFSRIVGAVVVIALCLTIAAPAAAVMHTAYTAYDTLSSVFGPEPEDEPHDEDNPWNDRERVNVLLLGGDSGSNRYGMRTDSMMVASIDVEYGDVVLIGLPRNLEDTQFPEGTALAEAYPPPQGFPDLLNEVYQTVADNPDQLAVDPDATDPAADTLKLVIGNITGIDLDYYALVDMKGFERLIDAIGGIDVHIDEPIPYGQEGDILEAGDQHLNGNEALWYGRSRVNSDDYTRMGRQGCLVKYVAEQADPATVLTSFQELAGATKQTLKTDIPQSKLPAFIELADLANEEGGMQTLQLSPPQVNTAYPDWEEIKRLVAEAVQKQEDGQSPQDDDLPAKPSPSAPESPEPSGQGAQDEQGPDGSTEWQDYTGLPDPSPTTPGRQVGDEATSLDKLCP